MMDDHGNKVKGCLRHLHLYCSNGHISKMRYVTNTYLEDLVVEFYDLARTSPQHLIARQLLESDNDNLFELSSHDDEPLHPRIQAMRNIYYLDAADHDS